MPTRLDYDATTPLVIATAVAVNPRAAPLVLAAQAVAIAAIVTARRRSGWSMFVMNAGAIALWHVLTGLAMRPFVEAGPAAGWAAAVGGIALVTGLAITLNYVTAAVSVWYLYGEEAARPDGDWAQHVKDLLSSVAVASVVVAAGAHRWLVALGAVAALWYGLDAAARYRRHLVTLRLEIESRVEAAERAGPLPGHTERVVATVAAAMADGDPRRVRRGIDAAWFHSLEAGGFAHRCNGLAPMPHVHDYARALPAARLAKRVLAQEGLPTPDHELLAHLVAAACAWDSRVLPGSPVRTSADLIHTFGIEGVIARRVVVLHPQPPSPAEAPAGAASSI
jgi:hypothetical protein